MTGRQIRVWRTHLGLSQAEAARLLGTSQARLSRWESGEPIGNPTMLERAMRDLERELARDHG